MTFGNRDRGIAGGGGRPLADIAARARLTFPLNLGDCFAYALARAEQCPILTLDEDFRAVDVPWSYRDDPPASFLGSLAA